jgi:mannose-6-phosphate isomerase-like protein (cupin superfamily)
VTARIFPIDSVREYQLGNQKEHTSRTIRDVFQSKNMRVHHAVYPPVHSSSKHSHQNSEEICYIIKGHGELVADERVMEFGHDTIIFIPAGSVHQFRNTGEEEMALIAIYAPPADLPKK